MRSDALKIPGSTETFQLSVEERLIPVSHKLRCVRLVVDIMKQAYVQFLKWTPLYEAEKPFQIFGDLLEESEDQRKTNLTWEGMRIQAHDVRQNAHSFQLDSHGFTICQLPGFTEVPDKKTISQEYIPAIENMLRKQLDDVGTVFVFDWRVRRTKHNQKSSLTTSLQIRESNTETKAGSKINFGDQSQPLLPSNYAHIDTCPISVIRRVQESFPDDAERILRQRVRAVKYVTPLFFFLVNVTFGQNEVKKK